MPYGTVNADLMTTSDGVSSAGVYGMKNRIINGDMRIDQRNAGAAVNPAVNGTYTLDRWRTDTSQTSKYSLQRNQGSVTPPAGYSNYLGVTSLSAYSLTSSDYFALVQNIEGFNISDLAFGSASAAPITISFWVRSSLTGTFGGSLTGGQTYPFTYTINAANTWERKTITLAGSTAGSWSTTNTLGMVVIFSLGAGSTNSGTAGAWSNTFYYSATGATSVVGTSGATFYITGVQLEKGSTATSFDYRDYGRELAMCQRYYYRLTAEAAGARFGNGLNSNTTSGNIITPFVVTMRTRPTALEQSGTAADYSVLTSGATVTTFSAVPTFTQSSSGMGEIGFTVASGLTAGQACIGRFASTTAYLGWSAEL